MTSEKQCWRQAVRLARVEIYCFILSLLESKESGGLLAKSTWLVSTRSYNLLSPLLSAGCMFQQRTNFGGFFPVSVKTCKVKLYLAFIMHILSSLRLSFTSSRLRLKCDGTRAETRFRLSTKRTSPFKSAGASVQSTTGRRAVHISLQGLYCSCKPVFCSHMTLTG